MCLEEAIQHFLSGYFSTCRRSDKTRAAYKIDLSQFGAFLGKLETLNNLTSDNLEQWARSLLLNGYAPASIRRKFATVRVFFSYWVRKRELDVSPLWKIRLDFAHERVLPRTLTSSDAKKLIEMAWNRLVSKPIAACPPTARAIAALRNVTALELLFATGMRVGELVNLCLRDWRDGEAAFVVKGKGSRQRMAFLPDDRSLGAVERYLQYRRAMHVDQDALLLNVSGKRITSQGIAKVIARVARDAGIENHVTPHMIRHTVATLLLRYGADLRIVQEVLGHASVATTQRYTHVVKDHLLATLKFSHPSRHIGIEIPMQALTVVMPA